MLKNRLTIFSMNSITVGSDISPTTLSRIKNIAVFLFSAIMHLTKSMGFMSFVTFFNRTLFGRYSKTPSRFVFNHTTLTPGLISTARGKLWSLYPKIGDRQKAMATSALFRYHLPYITE